MRRYFNWYNLDPVEGSVNDWYLKIPNYDLFRGLIETVFNRLKFTRWWALEGKANRGCVRINGMDKGEKEELCAFLDSLKTYKYAEIGERGLCISADFTYESPEQEERTEIGEAFNEAKFHSNRDGIKVVNEAVIRIVDALKLADVVDGVVCVPPNPARKGYYLPEEMAGAICAAFGINNYSEYLIKAKSTGNAKNSSLDEKRDMYKNVFVAGEKLKRLRLLLVDDLCQSGATLEAVKCEIEKRGAAVVAIVTLVKSLKDSANV